MQRIAMNLYVIRSSCMLHGWATYGPLPLPVERLRLCRVGTKSSHRPTTRNRNSSPERRSPSLVTGSLLVAVSSFAWRLQSLCKRIELGCNSQLVSVNLTVQVIGVVGRVNPSLLITIRLGAGDPILTNLNLESTIHIEQSHDWLPCLCVEYIMLIGPCQLFSSRFYWINKKSRPKRRLSKSLCEYEQSAAHFLNE